MRRQLQDDTASSQLVLKENIDQEPRDDGRIRSGLKEGCDWSIVR